MILVDTSAWVEFLRGTGSATDRAVAGLVADGTEIAISEVILMELLSGARDEAAAARLRSSLLSLPVLTLEGLADFEAAARLYRACRAAGETLRGLVDCLIAVPAIRADAAVLYRDRDFGVIARHSALQLHPI